MMGKVNMARLYDFETRADTAPDGKEYQIRYCTSPGKFEGEPLILVALWEAIAGGFADETYYLNSLDFESVDLFLSPFSLNGNFGELTEDETAYLESHTAAFVWEDDFGFSYLRLIDSKKELESAVANLEAESEQGCDDEWEYDTHGA